MIYIDTDVLIHAYIVQYERKHRQARKVIEEAMSGEEIAISTLTIQEALFVLDRLRVAKEKVESVYDALMGMQPIVYDVDDLKRAVEIAKRVGFRRINDCIHTAIAETHCTELVTYNRGDFNRIRDFAAIAIRIL